MAFLALGTLGFWIFLVLSFVVLSICVNYDDDSWNGRIATIILTIVAVAFFSSNTDVLHDCLGFISTHPVKTLLYVIGYFVVGVVWSFFKWYYFLLDYKKKEVENLKSYSHKTTVDIPSAKSHKSTIIMWMSYWVFSIYWTFLREWVTRAWTNLYNRFENLYDKMAKSVFKDVVIESKEVKK